MPTTITAVSVAVLSAIMLAACGNPALVHHAAATPAVNPTQACLRLHYFQLHNHGQGISAAFGRQLQEETRGTQLGTDIEQWLQDLRVQPSQIPGDSASSGPGPIESYLNQTVSDASAVAADCDGYGVRNTLGGVGSQGG